MGTTKVPVGKHLEQAGGGGRMTREEAARVLNRMDVDI